MWEHDIRDCYHLLHKCDLHIKSADLLVALRQALVTHAPVCLLQLHFSTFLAVEQLWVHESKTSQPRTGDVIDLLCMAK